MAAGLLAALVVTVGQLLGWHGVDTAAQVYRVNSFRTGGFELWDFQWYGGHWTLDYSVLYPALAATLSVPMVAVASAAVASVGFDRIVRRHLGPGAAAASLLFAAGTLVQASIGQLTFLTGEAFGLAALWAASRRRHALSLLLALACTSSSPLTAAFLALAVAAWALAGVGRGRPVRHLGLPAAIMAVAVGPLVVDALLFPGDGPMPYPVVDWLWEMAIAVVIGLLAGRTQPAIRAGALLWMLAATVSECVPSALGGNVGRIEDMVALPLAVGLAWTRVPLLMPVAAVPLALSQWVPAWGAFTASPSLASAHRAFFVPLDQQLQRWGATGPAGRVEVVPTAYHWEAAYVAPVMPLARGWERQLDVADDPIFYTRAALTPTSYRDWLLDNGVRFVALPLTSLDTAGRAEAGLVASGQVPGLRVVWRSTSWRLFEVEGGEGIVSGPAQLISATGGRVVIAADRAGPVTVRIRYSPDWVVTDGAGCVGRAGPSWIALDAFAPGTIEMALSLAGHGASACLPGRLAAARG